MKVENMMSPNVNSFAKVANQFIIKNNDGTYFQSYQTIIAVKNIDGSVELDLNKWNYSRTTSKYRNIFLNETTKETRAKIVSGEYILADLNG